MQQDREGQIQHGREDMSADPGPAHSLGYDLGQAHSHLDNKDMGPLGFKGGP